MEMMAHARCYMKLVQALGHIAGAEDAPIRTCGTDTELMYTGFAQDSIFYGYEIADRVEVRSPPFNSHSYLHLVKCLYPPCQNGGLVMADACAQSKPCCVQVGTLHAEIPLIAQTCLPIMHNFQINCTMHTELL